MQNNKFTVKRSASPCAASLLGLAYRSVEVSFPDGSCFHLRTHDLAVKAAQTIKLPGQTPTAHLIEQVLPLVQEQPEFLLEVAARLTWAEVQALAHSAFWRSPQPLLAAQFKTGTTMSLNL